ncbi:MAG: ABC transporter permease [Vicinamibacterales bacterium]|nr:ABC transporter permease [Acidobacteriota bacterium]MDP7472872.1 ABC transporter permease [Vicinamibacterales bacterium]MDP7670537.1 ABC transporter permease [Vicinamibacterales bacterium]HJO38194.1 ABC transporter permease [Vicinamibacterales bacterium]
MPSRRSDRVRERRRRYLRRFARRRTALLGLAVVGVFVVASVFAPYLAPYDAASRVGEPFGSPSWEHWLGTNDIGVDVLSELMFAGRISMMVGFLAAGAIIVLGTAVGLVSGYFGGAIDEALMRVTDIVLMLPRLPLMIVMAAYLGPGIWTIVVVYSSVGWASVARQIRSQVLSIRKASFIEASRGIGTGHARMLREHVLPNVLGIVVANGVMELMFAVLAEAGLSFLGLGDPANKSWGVMLYFAQIQGAFLRGAWWWILSPGLCIALLSCSVAFIGTAINDSLSPARAGR